MTKTNKDQILQKMQTKEYGKVSFEFAFGLINESEQGAF